MCECVLMYSVIHGTLIKRRFCAMVMFEKIMAEVLQQMVKDHFARIPSYSFLGSGSVHYKDQAGNVQYNAIWFQSKTDKDMDPPEPLKDDEDFPLVTDTTIRRETPFTRYGIAIENIRDLSDLDEQAFTIARELVNSIHTGMWNSLLDNKRISHVKAAAPWGHYVHSNPVEDIAFGDKTNGYHFSPSVVHMGPKTHRLLYDAIHLRCKCCSLHGTTPIGELYGIKIDRSMSCPNDYCFLFSRNFPQVQAIYRVDEPNVTQNRENYIETRWNEDEQAFEVYVDVAFVVYEPKEIVIIDTGLPKSSTEEE